MNIISIITISEAKSLQLQVYLTRYRRWTILFEKTHLSLETYHDNRTWRLSHLSIYTFVTFKHLFFPHNCHYWWKPAFVILQVTFNLKICISSQLTTWFCHDSQKNSMRPFILTQSSGLTRTSARHIYVWALNQIMNDKITDAYTVAVCGFEKPWSNFKESGNFWDMSHHISV